MSPARARAGSRRGPWRRAVVVLFAVLGLLALAAPADADTIRDQQRWALDAINAPAAWHTTRGAGVTVAVLDTGVDARHQDLAGAVLDSRDFVRHGAKPGERSWAVHGTAMAGIIAGRGHGAGRQDGVIGVAPEARILPVRVLLEKDDPARGEERDEPLNPVAEGIRWAVDQGVDIINLSLGDDSPFAHPDAEEDAAIRYALSRGVVVVASAGNRGKEGDPVSYPAGYPGVIAVTAVDRTGGRAPFSTQRWYATVSAPGQGLIIAAPGGDYQEEGWGTSAAAAFVSGSVALIRAAHPELTPGQIKRLLVETAQQAPEGGRSDALGGGVVDPAAAIAAAPGLDGRPAGAVAQSYGEEYFGPGPRPAVAAPPSTAWLAPAATMLGAFSLGAAALLLRRIRPSAAAG